MSALEKKRNVDEAIIYMKYVDHIERFPLSIGYLEEEEQIEDLCLVAVRENPNALARIHQQTEKVCLEAVKQNPFAIFLLKDIESSLTLSLYQEAVKQFSGIAHMLLRLEFQLMPSVQCEVEKIAKEAGSQVPLWFEDENLKWYALEMAWDYPEMIAIFEPQTEELCLKAIRRNPKALSYVKHQTKSLCCEAVSLNAESYLCVYDKSPELAMELYEVNPKIEEHFEF